MHPKVLHTLLHFVFGILSLQDPSHFVYGRDSFESHVLRENSDMNDSISTTRTLRLYNRCSNEHLRILPHKVIDAKGDTQDVYARLIIRTENFDGVTIQGEETGYYLCMNKKGAMVGRKRLKSGGSVTCVFTETINELDNYTEFRPVQKTDWYIGFTHTGEAKNIKRCRPGSRSVQFLKLPLPEDRDASKPDEDIQIIIDMLKALVKKSQDGNS